jgi:hypothetical protein
MRSVIFRLSTLITILVKVVGNGADCAIAKRAVIPSFASNT